MVSTIRKRMRVMTGPHDFGQDCLGESSFIRAEVVNS